MNDNLSWLQANQHRGIGTNKQNYEIYSLCIYVQNKMLQDKRYQGHILQR